MVRREITTLVDDIDGSEADETVQFAVDGVGYEIDLNADHAKALRESFADWVQDARKLGKVVIGGRTHLPTVGRKPATDRARNDQIREFARNRDMKISDRGRIPAEIVAAFDAEAPNF
ncbi:MAG: Lsr2 family protein [Acidimicrobiales bacterium]